MSKTKLPIRIDIPDSYMWVPMGVLLAHEETLDWYYENFINICCDNSMNGRLLDVSNGFLGFYCNAFSYSVAKYEDVRSSEIVDRLRKELLDEKNYAFIYLDEYYLSAKDSYQRRRYRHSSLIYGFDDDKCIFHAFAFDKNGHLAELEYPYEELKLAYEGGIDCPDIIIEPYAAAFFKVMPRFSHKIDFMNVIHSLEDYINGAKPKILRHVQSNIFKNNDIVPQCQTNAGPFGLNVARYMADRLIYQGKNTFDFNDFRRIHFLYDHAKMLMERFEYYKRYISEEYMQKYCESIENYRQIVGTYQRARLLYMKMNQHKNMTDEKYAVQGKYVQNVADTLRRNLSAEKAVLNQILMVLKDFWDNEQNRCGDYALLTAPESYCLDVIASDDGTMTAEIRFHEPSFVKLMRVAHVADITIWADDMVREELFYGDSMSRHDFSDVSVGELVSSIRIRFRSDYNVTFDDLNLKIFGGNIFYGKKITASSVWRVENDETKTQLPEFALSEMEFQYWRAAPQMGTYDGSDWLEIDLERQQPINRITIEEIRSAARIIKYRILSYDQKGNETVIGTYEFDTENDNIVDFPTVQASRIRLEFLECKPDRYNYAEPIVKLLRGFYVK